MKVFNPVFTINLANKNKSKSNLKASGKRISRKCLATVIKDDNDEFKAVINFERNDIQVDDKFTLKNEVLIIPFTEDSLNLKGKTYVWLKDKDEYGHNVCVIRTETNANRSPGVPTQYDAVKENILIAGHIVRKNGKMYFAYEDLISYHYLAESRIQDIKIDENKPLFSK